MGATLIASILALAGTLACGPSAVEPTTAPNRAKPPARTSTGVDIQVVGGELRVTYELLKPAKSIRFAWSENVRRDGWRSVTPGVLLQNSELRSEDEFTTATLAIPPDSREFDRVFPALTRAGEGVVLFGPALMLEQQDIEPTFDPALELTWPRENPLRGYVYLGPKSEVSKAEGVLLVGSRSVSPWLAQTISRETFHAFPYYARALDRPPIVPAVFVSGQSPGPMEFHGDVTDNGVIFLRFHGPKWDAHDERAASRVATFVRHEAFHLWNRVQEKNAPPWLHEGGAEYAALVAAVDSHVLSEDQGLEQVAFHLSGCRRALEDRPIDESPARGGAVYNCGVTVQWLADIEARRATENARDTFDIWGDLLTIAESKRVSDPEAGYSVDDFRKLTGELVATFLDAPGGARWTTLASLLEDYEVDVSLAPDDDEVRSALINHLLAVTCGDQPRGFWTESDHVRLDTGDRCGPLSGDPELVAIEGRALFGDLTGAFDATARACERKGTVALGLRGTQKKALAAPCSTPLRTPEAFHVATAPPMSRPANRQPPGR